MDVRFLNCSLVCEDPSRRDQLASLGHLPIDHLEHLQLFDVLPLLELDLVDQTRGDASLLGVVSHHLLAFDGISVVTSVICSAANEFRT